MDTLLALEARYCPEDATPSGLTLGLECEPDPDTVDEAVDILLEALPHLEGKTLELVREALEEMAHVVDELDAGIRDQEHGEELAAALGHAMNCLDEAMPQPRAGGEGEAVAQAEGEAQAQQQPPTQGEGVVAHEMGLLFSEEAELISKVSNGNLADFPTGVGDLSTPESGQSVGEGEFLAGLEPSQPEPSQPAQAQAAKPEKGSVFVVVPQAQPDPAMLKAYGFRLGPRPTTEAMAQLLAQAGQCSSPPGWAETYIKAQAQREREQWERMGLDGPLMSDEEFHQALDGLGLAEEVAA